MYVINTEIKKIKFHYPVQKNFFDAKGGKHQKQDSFGSHPVLGELSGSIECGALGAALPPSSHLMPWLFSHLPRH